MNKSIASIYIQRRQSWLRRKLITKLLLLIAGLKNKLGLEKAEEYYYWKQLLQYPKSSLAYDLALVLKQHKNCAKKDELTEILFLLVCPKYKNDVAFHYVLLGNGKRNISLIIHCTCLWILFAEKRQSFTTAYYFGKQLNKFSSWNLSFLFNESTETIKAMIFKESVGESEAPFIW